MSIRSRLTFISSVALNVRYAQWNEWYVCLVDRLRLARHMRGGNLRVHVTSLRIARCTFGSSGCHSCVAFNMSFIKKSFISGFQGYESYVSRKPPVYYDID